MSNTLGGPCRVCGRTTDVKSAIVNALTVPPQTVEGGGGGDDDAGKLIVTQKMVWLCKYHYSMHPKVKR